MHIYVVFECYNGWMCVKLCQQFWIVLFFGACLIWKKCLKKAINDVDRLLLAVRIFPRWMWYNCYCGKEMETTKIWETCKWVTSQCTSESNDANKIAGKRSPSTICGQVDKNGIAAILHTFQCGTVHRGKKYFWSGNTAILNKKNKSCFGAILHQ